LIILPFFFFFFFYAGLAAVLIVAFTSAEDEVPELDRIKRQSSADYFECPQASGMFADPKTCRRFITCVDKFPYLSHCPSGLFFDDITKSCTYKDKATCGPVSTSAYQNKTL
jgi:hypothetical protein